MIKSYKTKPNIKQAIKLSRDKEKFIFDWTNGKVYPEVYPEHEGIESIWWVETLEGTMEARNGDYLIKGLGGEFYSCKPDIFEKTYEEVE